MTDQKMRSRLGPALRALRHQNGLTLAALSGRTGFAVPTLSKIENNRMSLSYDKLIKLSEGLGVDVERLFAPIAAGEPHAVSGRRSMNRRGEGELVPTRNYDYRYLSTDVTRKKFIPLLVQVLARSREEFGDLVRHSGEEFVFVLEGVVEIHTELYAPLILRTCESAYIDSSMGHAYVGGVEGPCRMLAVCSTSEQDLRAVMRAGERRGAPKRKVGRGKRVHAGVQNRRP